VSEELQSLGNPHGCAYVRALIHELGSIAFVSGRFAPSSMDSAAHHGSLHQEPSGTDEPSATIANKTSAPQQNGKARISRWWDRQVCSLAETCARRRHSFWDRLCIEEASGSLGDLGTLIPLLVGCAKLGSVRVGPAMLWMGIFNIISGIQWDIPMAVQPMKSISAVAISDGLSSGAFAAAGILTGSAVLVLGLTQTIDLANRVIPRSVIAGMQIGLGIKMAAQSASYWKSQKWLDQVDCRATSLICLLFSFVLVLRTKLPTALIVFSIGLVLTAISMATKGAELNAGRFQLPVTVPQGDEWLDGLVAGALPQLPLTVLNSVISVCALSVDLFGDLEKGSKGVTRVSVSSSVGLMNLVGCWFGGMPSCHGAGGLAGHYKFGARGGMSVIMLGAVKVVLALSLGEGLNTVIEFYPVAVLGVLLLFAGVELASVGAKALQASETFNDDLLPCFITAGVYIGTRNLGLGVLAGLLTAAVQRWENISSLMASTVTKQFKSEESKSGCEGTTDTREDLAT